jgi:hypothetical protein
MACSNSGTTTRAAADGRPAPRERSTPRYRLARIGALTGYDLRNLNVRFNLHAATRAWRFLNLDT